MKLDPEKITEYISAAEGSYDVSQRVIHDHGSSQEIMVWLLESIACSLMSIARTLAYKENHGDD